MHINYANKYSKTFFNLIALLGEFLCALKQALALVFKIISSLQESTNLGLSNSYLKSCSSIRIKSFTSCCLFLFSIYFISIFSPKISSNFFKASSCPIDSSLFFCSINIFILIPLFFNSFKVFIILSSK